MIRNRLWLLGVSALIGILTLATAGTAQAQHHGGAHFAVARLGGFRGGFYHGGYPLSPYYGYRYGYPAYGYRFGYYPYYPFYAYPYGYSPSSYGYAPNSSPYSQDDSWYPG